MLRFLSWKGSWAGRIVASCSVIRWFQRTDDRRFQAGRDRDQPLAHPLRALGECTNAAPERSLIALVRVWLQILSALRACRAGGGRAWVGNSKRRNPLGADTGGNCDCSRWRARGGGRGRPPRHPGRVRSPVFEMRDTAALRLRGGGSGLWRWFL
jgi:hypothetical protein